jgi:hypothetical protein
MTITSSNLRHQLDTLFAFDSAASVVFGILALLSPHHVVEQFGGGTYNHAAHETLRCVEQLFNSRNRLLLTLFIASIYLPIYP